MWIVIHMAKSSAVTDGIRALLENEGILVKVKPVYKKMSREENYYEILVLESEAEEAREIIIENGL